ncbi:MAG: hypothetical protein ACREQW_04185, partial [Candidatus Binatia bacterium]
AGVDEALPGDSDERTSQAKTFAAGAVEDVAQNQPATGDPRDTPRRPIAEPEEDAPAAVDPEILAPNAPATLEDRIASSRRSAAVDSEIRALVKQYGEVDIYSNRQGGGKQNLVKAAVTGLLLIAALAVSYLFLL